MSGSKSGEICCWNTKKGELDGNPLTVKSFFLNLILVILSEVQKFWFVTDLLIMVDLTFFLGSQEMDYWYIVGTSPP